MKNQVNNRQLQVLGQSAKSLQSLLQNAPEAYLWFRESEESWCIQEVVAHLVLCEEFNWIPRIRLIMNSKEQAQFEALDMKAHLHLAQKASISHLLERWVKGREQSIADIAAMNLSEEDFAKTAQHPVLGEVSIAQLFAAWLAHDLAHTAQVCRLLAKTQKEELGEYKRFLRIVGE